MRPWSETAKSTRSARPPPSRTRCAARSRRTPGRPGAASEHERPRRGRDRDDRRAQQRAAPTRERSAGGHYAPSEKMTGYSAELFSCSSRLGTGSTSIRMVRALAEVDRGEVAEDDASSSRRG